MVWLNWSLKPYIRLRTISLLISTTHITHVYVQWLSYSFVWLYLIKCVFTCSIFVDSRTKIFLSVLGVFGKYFVLQKKKTENFKKQCCPVLATQSQVSQVACHSRELTGQFWRLVHEWKVQSQGGHRDFRGLVRDSLASKTSNREKRLEIFSKLLAWSVLAGGFGDYLATYLNCEKCVFCTVKTVFKIFFSFPSNFLWLFIFSLNYLLPKRSV